MRGIWPDAIVEENNITVSMSILRKTLGETAGTISLFETVPGVDIASSQKLLSYPPDQIASEMTFQSPFAQS